ncbi:lantibiotic dehydratase [Streptomyces sp. JJ38]|uniref:lantibiotic dehydratase n=1 Tax=Streptomyces sp. JJ38 TaxID=2738128 RepID=UPI001C56D317|nr:lantibiotic dehydratase [Streptomyces sp. JJ38]MBW1599429.1 lantibiotic dehydratase [Streptomyces sp. JJ38]
MFLASRSVSQASREDFRAAATLRAYDIRSRWRSTPHGGFSGVAPASFGNGPEALLLHGEHQAVTSPRPHWLAAVSDQLLDHPRVLTGLRLSRNNLVRRRGDRLEIEHPGPDGTVQKTSVRATTVSLGLLDACASPVLGKDLMAELIAQHPRATERTAEGALRHMVRGGLLLSDLLPVDPRDDALGHMLERLPPGAPLRPVLDRLRALLRQADTHCPGHADRLRLLCEARDMADAIHRVERPFAADTIVNATITLPERLAHDAARAADLLWRVGHLAAPAADYHQRFLDRYGAHRMVPLTEAIDPATGIGPPEKETAAGELSPTRATSLSQLLGTAVAHGHTEVVLDEGFLESLAHDDAGRPPRTAEIHVRVLRAPEGDLRLAVCPEGGSQDAGAASGRFARRLPQLAPAPQRYDDGPLVAEIVCRARTDKAGGLATETGYATHRIPVGVPERSGDIALDDLLLASNGSHLVLYHHDRQVIPVLFSRLAPDLLPTTARVLQLLGHAGERPWHPWSWGAAGYAPFTPQVRHRNVILSPARWRLPTGLIQRARRHETWEGALSTWRAATMPTPPRTVHIEESDRHLPVDLDHPTDRELLRRSVNRGVTTVTEPLGAPDNNPAVLPGPHGRHFLDLTVRLARRSPGKASRRAPRAAARPQGADSFLPGGPWLSASIPAPFDHHEAILRQLPALLDAHQDVIERWFFLRYQTQHLGPHLRVRFHGAPTTVAGTLLPALSRWSDALRDQQLAGAMVLEPYERETERYGGSKAIDAAETVFAADSAYTLPAMAALPDAEDRLLLAAESAAEIARHTPEPRTALRGRSLTASARRRRDTARPRLGSGNPDFTPLTALRNARTKALHRYLETLTPEATALCASDLIHMHCNRLLGPHHDAEAVVRSLASDLTHRHERD